MTHHVPVPMGKNAVPVDFLWLELTKRCNLECTHCYAESGPDATESDLMQAEDYIRVMDEAYALGCRQVQFIGGEPTLNKSLPDLIRHAHRRGFDYIEVFTNLMHMPDALLQLIRQLGVHVATSVYGATPEVHNAVTRNPTSHGRTMGNLLKLKEQQVPVRAGVIEMEQNAAHIDATLAYLDQLGIPAGRDRLRHFGRGAQPGEAGQITELCGTCAGGTLRIGPDGSVSPCNMSAGWNVGSVLNQSLGHIMAEGKLNTMRERIYREVVEPQQQLEMASCAPTQCNPYNSCCPTTQRCNPCGPHGCNPCRPAG